MRSRSAKWGKLGQLGSWGISQPVRIIRVWLYYYKKSAVQPAVLRSWLATGGPLGRQDLQDCNVVTHIPRLPLHFLCLCFVPVCIQMYSSLTLSLWQPRTTETTATTTTMTVKEKAALSQTDPDLCRLMAADRRGLLFLLFDFVPLTLTFIHVHPILPFNE